MSSSSSIFVFGEFTRFFSDNSRDQDAGVVPLSDANSKLESVQNDISSSLELLLSWGVSSSGESSLHLPFGNVFRGGMFLIFF